MLFDSDYSLFLYKSFPVKNSISVTNKYLVKEMFFKKLANVGIWAFNLLKNTLDKCLEVDKLPLRYNYTT